MPFPPKVQEDAMVACHRQCCLCHRLKHTKMQCHHIIPHADGGEDTFDNCIPLCLECHGEVMAYNPKHPIGTQYSASELKRRRNEWYEALKNPQVTVLGPAHVKIDREMVKRLRYVCPERTMQDFFCDQDYGIPFKRAVLDALRRLHDFGKQVESHFLDPALESLFAEFTTRVLDMMQTLLQTSWCEEDDLHSFAKLSEWINDPQEYESYMERREQLVSRANNAARDLYKSYVELIHECRLRLEISTIGAL